MNKAFWELVRASKEAREILWDIIVTVILIIMVLSLYTHAFYLWTIDDTGWETDFILGIMFAIMMAIRTQDLKIKEIIKRLDKKSKECTINSPSKK